jgi:prepilin-type processing-associated H-X9-DG protein
MYDSSIAAVSAPVNMAAVTDGTSNTIFAIESAGRPYLYQGTQTQSTVASIQAGNGINGGGWCRPASDIWLIGSNAAGTVVGGSSFINVNNGFAALAYPITIGDISNVVASPAGLNTFGTGAVYSFHPAGVNAVFVDGSVCIGSA